MIELISPKNGVEISVLTDVHRAFLEGERTGLNKNVEALEKVKRKETRETLMKLMRETAEELFLAKDLFDKSMGKS